MSKSRSVILAMVPAGAAALLEEKLEATI